MTSIAISRGGHRSPLPLLALLVVAISVVIAVLAVSIDLTKVPDEPGPLADRGLRIPEKLPTHPHASAHKWRNTNQAYAEGLYENTILTGKCPVEEVRCGRDSNGPKVLYVCIQPTYNVVGRIIIYLERYMPKEGLAAGVMRLGPIIGTGWGPKPYNKGNIVDWLELPDYTGAYVSGIDDEGDVIYHSGIDDWDPDEWEPCEGPKWKGVRKWLATP